MTSAIGVNPFKAEYYPLHIVIQQRLLGLKSQNDQTMPIKLLLVYFICSINWLLTNPLNYLKEGLLTDGYDYTCTFST